MATFTIATVQDAKRALEYFNDFHDGFVKRIEIVSRQAFTAPGSTICTHVFDAVLKIAHYNYCGGHQPLNRQIACSFRDVSRVFMDFRDLGETGWNINALEIRGSAGMLIPVLHRNQYDGHAWVIRQHELFQFQTAEWFEEIAEDIVVDFEDD
jgi:hypothetical protein